MISSSAAATRATIIKDYFCNYFTPYADMTVDLSTHEIEYHNGAVSEPWRVTLVDTGDATMTGGRLRRVRDTLERRPFCFTYGDGVGNVDISEQIEFHEKHGKLATMTAVQLPGRFGAFTLGGRVGHASRAFTRSRPVTVHGSTAGSSSCEPEASATSRATRPSGSGSRWNGWRATASCALIGTSGSGSPWIPCATRCCWRDLWSKGKAPWKVW